MRLVCFGSLETVGSPPSCHRTTRPAKFSRSKGDPKCATFEPPRRVRTGMIKPVISGKFPNPIGQATRLIPCRRDGEFFMEFLQQLKSLQPQQDNTPAIQLRRAIGSLRHAGRNSDTLAPRQRKLFERRMEKMCCDLSLWLEAVSVREIH